jgi:protein involved in polysaccharide export with SLBB domain
MMNYQCQRGVLLGSLLWAISLAATGQTTTDVLSSTPGTAVSVAPPATAAPVTPSDLALYELKNSLSLGSFDTAGQGAPVANNVGAPSADTTLGDQPARPRIEPARVNNQPSNFQRFVQQATGRLLPVYGQQLFSAPSGYVPVTQAPAPNDYILGPGDEIRLQIWGSIDADKRLVINRDGQVFLPKVGAINLTGVRAGDLESVLRSKVGRIFTNFDLNATLGRLRSVQIYVVGQALQPGTYTVSSLSTLINALFEVGGPSNAGSMRNIQLKRNGRIVGNLDLYDFIARGDRGGDVPLQPGDVIVIPPVGPRVAVLGALEQPAIYELKGAGSVGEVLALGGGLSVLAKSRKALLERIDPAAGTARRVEDFTLDKAGLQHALRDGDILTLFEISPQFANAVTLRGNVAEPLRYPYTEGMRIRDLIPDREALITPDYYRRKNLLVLSSKTDAADVEFGVRKLLDEVNWEYAVIERLDRATLTTRLIPFNLGRAVNEGDDQHNLVLQPGDIVTILSKNDLRVPQDRQTRLVRVEGEVAAPGIYQVEAGETLPQLLARLGGVTPNAYLYGAEFTRESVRQQQQKNLDAVIRKLEAQLQSELGKQLSDANAAAEAKDQLLSQQQQLERMKTFKSNGRVSLELPPTQLTLEAIPALPLEDGDAVHIPSRPGFVTAVGEVYNENAIIYRSGRTVGDVLEVAGATNNAELGYAFVLRADGSVMTARDNKSLFSLRGFEDIELMPGDTVVIPAKLDRRTTWTKFVTGLKDWTQVLYQLGLGVAAWDTLRNW